DVLASSSIINSQVPSTPSQNITEGNLSDVFMNYQHIYETENDIWQYPYALIESVNTNSLSANFIEQSNDSLPITTSDTDFLRSNNQDESTEESHKSDSEIKNQNESNEADKCSNPFEILSQLEAYKNGDTQDNK
ncbi:21499_t:CDS:2, partial [Racocetra persica]